MKLGVIIVTYNRLELLKECIEACVNQSYLFEKIFVVDNASTDGTNEYLSTLNYDNLEYKTMLYNTGGSGGFYEGVKFFKEKDIDYTLFIDDDAIIDIDYNKKINEYMINDKNSLNSIVAYSGTVLTNDNIMYEHRRFLKTGFKQRNSSKKDYEAKYFDYELSTFCGVFISNKIIKKIGLPKKEFFIWYDDTEYCLRFKKYGKIRNINEAFLIHKTNIDNSTGYNWKSYYGIRNKYIILEEYYNIYFLYKYILEIYFYIITSYIFGIVKKNSYYRNVSELYKNAFKDAKNKVLGVNEKYTYKKDFGRKNEI